MGDSFAGNDGEYGSAGWAREGDLANGSRVVKIKPRDYGRAP
jgi:hypothetical protein